MDRFVGLITLLVLIVGLTAGTQMDGDFRLDLGWHDDFTTDRGWWPEPWEVAEPDDRARAQFDGKDAEFMVLTAGRQMAWTRTTNPVWLKKFPFLEMEYEVTAEGKDPPSCIFWMDDDCTGPITPGALNAENPQANAARWQSDLSGKGRQRTVVDLGQVYKGDRVARLGVKVSNRSGPVTLRMCLLAFHAGDPRGRSAHPTTAPQDLPVATGPSGILSDRPMVPEEWLPIPLTDDRAISIARWAEVLTPDPESLFRKAVESAGVPFCPGEPARFAMATGVMETESLDLMGNWQGSELVLLLASRVFGTAQPSFGKGEGSPRRSIDSPHQLVVETEYADGFRGRQFPRSITRRTWSVTSGPEGYVVALDPARRLVRISVMDRMTYGQVFLLAASIHQASRRTVLDDVTEVPPVAASRPASPVFKPGRCSFDGGLLTIENEWVRMVFEIQKGLLLKSLTLVPFDRRLVIDGQSIPLIEVRDDKDQSLPLQFQAEQRQRTSLETMVDLTWSVGPPDSSHDLRVRLQFADEGKIRIVPVLINDTETAWSPDIVCPRFRGWRISPDRQDRWYLLGMQSTRLGHENFKTDAPYSGLFPLQVMDLFAPQAGGGLGLWIEDAHLLAKSFSFEQTDSDTSLAVRYSGLVVEPGQHIDLPATVLLPHLDDWHQVYDRYRRWIRQRFQDRPVRSIGNMFFCRRDYPLGGTGLLFDRYRRTYVPGNLVRESRSVLGGIDMIDISGWAYNELNGRVGEYRTNDLGGLSALKQCADSAHEAGVRLGLYFEGYLVDRRSTLGERSLPAWQMLDRQGNPRWWGNEQVELFNCPAVPEWRNALAQDIAEVARTTSADAVYLDEFGLAGEGKLCWSEAHGHPVPSNPLTEEQAMIAAVRRQLDQRTPNAAIYIEYVPCDGMMDQIDAAFDYGMTMGGPLLHETKLPLHRFVFPEVAFVQMIGYGIRPIPVEADDLHRCLFHGVSIWLKGRSASWFSPGFQEDAPVIYRILREQAELFRSPRCEPLMPTLQSGLYANRFEYRDRILYTVYNARYADISGDLFKVSGSQADMVQDLWSDRPARFRRELDDLVIQGKIGPRSAGAFLMVK